MLTLLQILIHTVQGLALWTAFRYRSNMKGSMEQYFFYYLVFAVLNEIVVISLLDYFDFPSYIFYNTYDLVTYGFTIYYFYQVLAKKKTVLILGLFYILTLAVSLFYENFFLSFLSINVYGGTIVTLILAILFFASLLQKAEVINYTKIPAFWITAGWLTFNIGYLPVQFILNTLSPETVSGTSIYIIMAVLNILQYGAFTLAFLCFKKK